MGKITIRNIKYSTQEMKSRGCLSFSTGMFLPYFTQASFEIAVQKIFRITIGDLWWLSLKYFCTSLD